VFLLNRFVCYFLAAVFLANIGLIFASKLHGFFGSLCICELVNGRIRLWQLRLHWQPEADNWRLALQLLCVRQLPQLFGGNFGLLVRAVISVSLPAKLGD